MPNSSEVTLSEKTLQVQNTKKTLKRHRTKLVKPHRREDHRTPVPTHHSAPHRREDREADIVVNPPTLIVARRPYHRRSLCFSSSSLCLHRRLETTFRLVSVQPFILKSQLYSSVKDRTQVDRELGSLRRDKVLRIFKLNTGQDDYAIMFLDDYIKQIDQVFKRMEGKKEMEYEVFGWFKNYILDSKLETGIEHCA
ncbi:uncharacterized protein LOC110265097 [Arachis ipaensis]|uniref:uncharacterized protein LOC110265097 n=1 Tax=Arachis ipaensis TaxID=130454 RepID=UPI000A2B0F6A|nr:uncharacterized protein LOC110265097 [Arachis ipaensis]